MSPIDVDHTDLLNMANYADEKVLKKLYRNYGSFHNLAEAGNVAAIIIWLDLKQALNNSQLTDKQRNCIILHLINKELLVEVAEFYGITDIGVIYHITGGLKKIHQTLENGYCYWYKGAVNT